jgi:hypothetical protein
MEGARPGWGGLVSFGEVKEWWEGVVGGCLGDRRATGCR